MMGIVNVFKNDYLITILNSALFLLLTFRANMKIHELCQETHARSWL